MLNNNNSPSGNVIDGINAKEDLMRFHKNFTAKYIPPTKTQTILGVIAWLIVYGIGGFLLLYMLFSLLMDM